MLDSSEFSKLHLKNSEKHHKAIYLFLADFEILQQN